jgi:uncharacterized repeat protein (TIGR03803 family)
MTTSESTFRAAKEQSMNKKFSAMTIGVLALAALACVAQAQTFQVIHYFTGGADGAYPGSGLIIDRAGHIYGAAGSGGMGNNGTVFELKRLGSGWTIGPIYEFRGGNDGSSPDGVVFGPEGLLYGATFFGGGADNAGIAYALQPPATVCKTTTCFWSETILHSFGSGTDGVAPASALISDQAGNLYGTTEAGGADGAGTVYELTKSGNSWTENVLYPFLGGPNDGFQPIGGLVFDMAGNLYGTTATGGANGDGIAFELTPSNGSWSEGIVYNFSNNNIGSYPDTSLVVDQTGNLYGMTWIHGSVFELTRSNGNWNASALYTATYFGSGAALTMDQAGDLYGVSCVGSNGGSGSGSGFIFKLTNSNGTWTLSDLHDFNGSDSKCPFGSVTPDAAGNLWGTTEFGGQGCGSNGCGVVWEITAQ